MSELCTDDRFEIIERYKKELIEATNISTSPDEMAVLDDILFRFWQMGWLKKRDTGRSTVTIGSPAPSASRRLMEQGRRWRAKEAWIPIYYDNKAMFYQCPYCGARYMLQTRFCGNCGKVVYHE